MRMLVVVVVIMIAGRQSHVMHGTVFNARFRDHFLCKRRNALVLASHHHHLDAALVGCVHMHARNDRLVMRVLLFGHAGRQTAGMMIKTETHDGHALGLARVVKLILRQFPTQQISKRFGSVFVASFGNQCVKRFGNFVVNRNRHSLHRSFRATHRQCAAVRGSANPFFGTSLILLAESSLKLRLPQAFSRLIDSFEVYSSAIDPFFSESMTPRQSFSSHPRIRDAAALGFTSSLGPFAANGIMPGFHAMAEDFGVSFVAVQQSLTIYLFTYAFFSLVAGSFSDSYGRRPTFIGGMLLFAAASIGAAFSQSLWALYGWRLLQGIGAAVGQVVTQAIVRDNWSGPEAANVNGMIAFFFAAGPALAPVVGGQIVMLFGWHAVFLFLLVYSLSIAAFIYYRIPETLHATDRSPFNLSAVCGNYAKGLTHGAFMTGVIAHGILFMGGILYSAGSADFVIKVMGLDVDEFGWLSIPLIFASFAGAWGSIRLAKRLRPKRMIIIVSVLTLAGSVLAALFDYIAEPGFLLLLIAPVLYSLGMALLRPVMMAMNLDYFPKNRGMAAAIQQFFVTASFCFSAAVWVPIVMGSAWKYALASAFCAFLVLALWLVSMRLRPEALKRAGVPETMR